MIILKKREGGNIISIPPQKVEFITVEGADSTVVIVIGRRAIKLFGVARPEDLLRLKPGEHTYTRALLIPNYDEYVA